MTFQLQIHPQDGYLHVVVSGTANYDNALTLWQEIVKACDQYQCYCILGEQNIAQSISIGDAYDHPQIFSDAGVSYKHRIAWVDHNANSRKTTEFIRDVLSSRHLGQGQVFADVDKARQWLLKHQPHKKSAAPRATESTPQRAD